MTTQVQIRGNVEATQEARTLVSRELDINTTDKRISVHDGLTAGGIPHANYADVQNQTFTYAAATGTNALTLTLAKAPSAYVAGMTVTFKAQNTNTGSTTVNVNSLGAKTIKTIAEGGAVAIGAGSIIQNGIYTVIYDGTDFLFVSGGGSGGLVDYQVFTSSGTWTKPAGCNAVKVTVVGGGGAGGSPSLETAGGTSSFGSHCSATGGQPGDVAENTSSVPGGAGGNGTGGDLNIEGGGGINSGRVESSTDLTMPGAGGSSYFGGGGKSGDPGAAYGSGGGGGFNSTRSGSGGGAGGASVKYINSGLGSTETVTIGAGGTSTSSGNGAPGVVIVEAYS